MAAGKLDVNGVWLYGEDDARDTFSALLNIGQDSVSDAVGSDRARITALEDAGATSGVGSPFTVATGFTLTSGTGRKKNGVAFVNLLVLRTGAAITVPSDGNVANTLLATLNSGWQRIASGNASMIHDGFTGPIASGFINAAGECYLGAVVPGMVINPGTNIGLNAVYLLA